MNIEQLFIDEESTVLEAMHKIGENSKKILFVQNNRKLLAVITDGDIRRWILAGGSLDGNIREMANYNPLYLFDCSRSKAKEFMKKKLIEAVPIVDQELNIITIIFLNDSDLIFKYDKINIPVVIMAGGLGTRLYPYTKILPKPLIPIGEIPIVEHIINQFYQYGCRDFYLILNYKKNMIKAYFNDLERDYRVHYIDEEKPLGTGGGVSLLKGKIESTFILSNCDILINEDFTKIYKDHKEKNNKITMVCSLKNFEIPYGVVDIANDGTIENMREKPKMTFLTNTGCYIVEPEIIRDIPADTFVGFPDIVDNCKEQGERVGVYPIGEKTWHDMGELDLWKKTMEHIDEIQSD